MKDNEDNLFYTTKIVEYYTKLSKIIRSSYAYGEETHNTTPHYAILLYTAKGNGARGERED